eukprot:5393985-Pyramimonas_sp.AAC.1
MVPRVVPIPIGARPARTRGARWLDHPFVAQVDISRVAVTCGGVECRAGAALPTRSSFLAAIWGCEECLSTFCSDSINTIVGLGQAEAGPEIEGR